eukprot:Phypoly_transcript_13455.p1 GENE.Phypoly_transcript_13455~~Phypoly_transcript_13455.p1  ORF type:complete len:319 (-),score=74.30 Phypoly_transcript_13455:104-1012(-)
MGKKKKNKGEVVQVYCWYCERKFEDEKVLVAHQKAKHFKCHVCHKKLTTAGGMVVHVFQVHKENITKVPNSKPGRDSVKYEIYGMEGIPEEGDEDDENPNKRPRLDTPTGVAGMPPPLLPTPLYGQPFPGAPPQQFGPPGFQGGYPPGPWTPGATGMLPPPAHIPPQFPPGAPPGAIPSQPPSAPGRPLFPIQNPGAPGFAPPGAPGAFPAYANPQHTQQPTSPNQPLLQLPHAQPPYGLAPGAQQSDAYLVYDDETMSVEEKRAELERYRYDEEVLKQQMNKIDQSIEFRVSQMIGSRVGM